MSHWPADPRDAARLRDRNVRLLRRIGAGVVSLGVFGSFGLAGYLAGTSHQQSSAAASSAGASTGDSASPQAAGQSAGGTVQQWLRELRRATARQQSDEGGQGAEGGDDGGGFVLQLPQLGTGQPPALGNGSGSAPHATTQGS